MDPGQPSASTPKRSIHAHKTLIWWDQEGVLSYEHLRSNVTIIVDRYHQQLCRFSDKLMQKNYP